jgi:hypothetical protein
MRRHRIFLTVRQRRNRRPFRRRLFHEADAASRAFSNFTTDLSRLPPGGRFARVRAFWSVVIMQQTEAIDRKYFFDRIRRSLFGGRLTQSQVDAIERYLDYRDAIYPNMPDAELAYLLATVKHETAHEMVPIEERGGEAYLRSKPYYPWYGRGPIQLTWEANYRKFGITNPDDALKWPAALDIAFRGMILGMFTGRKLAHYINARKRDYIGARRIINGTDKARLIAGYADLVFDALTQSRARRAA